MILGKPIALGRTAEVYACENGQVLKLFRPPWGRAAAESEARLARTVHAAGTAVGEVIEYDGRFGLPYAHVEGRLLVDVLFTTPWKLAEFARGFADIHARVHAHVLPELPSQRQRLEDRLRSTTVLPGALKDVLLGILASLPDGDRVCHGDFHPANVLVTAHGPVIVDWTDATRRNPVADIARTLLLFQLATEAAPLRRLMVAGVRSWFRRVYLGRYRLVAPLDEAQLMAWQSVIAAARLREEVLGEADRLMRVVHVARR